MLCPVRRKNDHSPEERKEFELNSIRNDPDKLVGIRSRLSDVAWWMRRLYQNIDASARMVRADKSGSTPVDMAPIFERLKLDVGYWKLQIQEFGRLFSHIAGKPKGCLRDAKLNFQASLLSKAFQTGTGFNALIRQPASAPTARE